MRQGPNGQVVDLGAMAPSALPPEVPDPRAVSRDAATSDADLLHRCRDGDAAAWEAVITRYERLVFSVALRNGSSREDAADITQSTFVALLDGIDHIRQHERLGSWLVIVARRHARRTRRRGDREQPWDDPGTGSEDPIQDWERAAWVRSGFRQLAKPCRDLLGALYFDPRSPSYAEIAERLGRAIGGIGPTRARCLEQLRTVLGEDDVA